MQTQLWRLQQNKEANENMLQAAAKLIAAGEVVAFPTETVYGLGANGLSQSAAQKIFAAKGRPADNPLILHIAAQKDILPLTTGLSANAKALMQKFWPGPLTLVVPKSALIPEAVSAGLGTVAVRFPRHELAQRLIRLAGCPIAAPSANKSGRPSPTNAEDVLEDMQGIIAGVIDGGNCGIGVESTVVDTTGPLPMILRPGGITKEMLEELLGVVEVDPALSSTKDFKPKAPGMKYRHYAPQAQMYIVEGAELDRGCLLFAEGALAQGLHIGVICPSSIAESLAKLGTPETMTIISWGQEVEQLAENFYTALRTFDHAQVDVILATGVAETGLGLAVMNRMRKAAGNNILQIKNKKLILQSGTQPSFL